MLRESSQRFHMVPCFHVPSDVFEKCLQRVSAVFLTRFREMIVRSPCGTLTFLEDLQRKLHRIWDLEKIVFQAVMWADSNNIRRKGVGELFFRRHFRGILWTCLILFDCCGMGRPATRNRFRSGRPMYGPVVVHS